MTRCSLPEVELVASTDELSKVIDAARRRSSFEARQASCESLSALNDFAYDAVGFDPSRRRDHACHSAQATCEQSCARCRAIGPTAKLRSRCERLNQPNDVSLKRRGFLSRAFGKCSQMPRPVTHVPEHLCHLYGRYVPSVIRVEVQFARAAVRTVIEWQ